MADAGDDEDLFADLYDDNTEESASAPAAPTKTEPVAAQAPTGDDFERSEPVIASGSINTGDAQNNTNFDTPQGMGGMDSYQDGGGYQDSRHEERPIGTKEDGKMFIGGLNWETTDESLKNYFSQFGEVIECTVMRDGATGRSRGFGFLTFKDPKTVNTVMVKEHQLDGKLIDPKRAIPRDEQERTAKIFVGGVSQDATESDFKEFFMKFGRVLDATLMMDKDTGRPRGFGFVTFDNDMAVERTLEGPLSILGKPIEVKRAQPRGKMGEEEPQHNKFGRGGKGQGWSNNAGGGGGNGGFNPNQMAQGGGDSGGGTNGGMTPAMMAQYWQRMQQYFAMMSGMQANTMTPQMMNPQMMANPMVQQMMAQRGMNPQMMQQFMMQQQQGQQGGQQGSAGGQSPMNNGSGSPGPGGQQRGGFNAQEQMMFEQQKYEQQQRARMMMAQNGAGGNTWEGMYDDEPQPQGMGPQGGNMRGGYRGGRGGGGGGGFHRGGSGPPAQAPNAPANAPTGPKNAGRPGANYRGGGRGGHRGGFHPYARGGG